MRNKYIEAFENAQIASKNIPDFRAGDTLRVATRIGANSVGVERIFPIFSDSIEEIKVLRKGRVRRAKLFYLRDLRGKAAKIRELRK